MILDFSNAKMGFSKIVKVQAENLAIACLKITLDFWTFTFLLHKKINKSNINI